MKKPKPTTKTNLDWNDVTDFIEKKYGKDIRDWQAKFEIKNGKLTHNEDREYCDFWHLICDRNNIHNGCYFYINKDVEQVAYGEYDKDWVREIHKIIIDEFGEYGDAESIEFYTEW